MGGLPLQLGMWIKGLQEERSRKTVAEESLHKPLPSFCCLSFFLPHTFQTTLEGPPTLWRDILWGLQECNQRGKAGKLLDSFILNLKVVQDFWTEITLSPHLAGIIFLQAAPLKSSKMITWQRQDGELRLTNITARHISVWGLTLLS